MFLRESLTCIQTKQDKTLQQHYITLQDTQESNRTIQQNSTLQDNNIHTILSWPNRSLSPSRFSPSRFIMNGIISIILYTHHHIQYIYCQEDVIFHSSPQIFINICQKHKQGFCKWIKRDFLKGWREVIDFKKLGKVFQSDGALNWEENQPISFWILGTKKKQLSVWRK